MDRSAALRPLDEAAEWVRRLDEYRSPAELNQAVAAVGAAVDRSIRLMLRSDHEAPDDHRLGALSEEAMPAEEVVRSLRSRGVISIETAGALHQMTGAAARARGGAARAADADLAKAAVDRVRAESSAGDSGPADGDSGPAAGSEAGPDAGQEADPAPGPDAAAPPSDGSAGRWMAWAGSAFAILFLAGLAWVLAGGGDDQFDAAVAAFRAERWDSAAEGFERVLEERPVDVTSMLYLGRIYRRQGRLSEAADVLREAGRAAPEDADVLRETGHLMLDMGDPVAAIAEYERALEHDPDSALNWVGLIRALRAANDPRAEQVLERAPPEARATLERPRP